MHVEEVFGIEVRRQDLGSPMERIQFQLEKWSIYRESQVVVLELRYHPQANDVAI